MDAGEGFFMTLPSDGSYKTFPENTVAEFKTLLPQTIDLTSGEWEVGLTEVQYSGNVENISEKESYVDVIFENKYENLIENPDQGKTGRFRDEQLTAVNLRNILPMTDWKDSFYNNNFKKREENKKIPPEDTKMTIHRLFFKSGEYANVDELINEINLALLRTFRKLWIQCGGGVPQQRLTKEQILSLSADEARKQLAKQTEKIEERILSNNNLQLFHDKTFDRLEYHINGRKLREECLFAIRFPISLAYKLGFDDAALFLESNHDVGKFIALATMYNQAQGKKDEAIGFGHTKWINVAYHPRYSLDLSVNLKQLFIYCDVVEPQIVGSNQLKLMRVVPIYATHPPNWDNYQNVWEPRRVEYLKLSKKHFDTIEIQIRTPLGTVFPFLSGRTVVKLHFKKAY